MTPTPHAQLQRAHADRRARRRLDPAQKATVLTAVFGKRWIHIVEQHGSRTARNTPPNPYWLAAMIRDATRGRTA